jgi:oligopeptide transport system substrate-binding protein
MLKFFLPSIFLFLSLIQINADDLPVWKKALAPKSDAWKKVDQHFFYNNDAEPESLDPAVITGLLEFRLVDALFEGLVTLDPKTLDARPAVAESWVISEDRLIYTFKLRKSAKWSNGQAVTATDFFNAWERVLNPKQAAPYNYQLFPIKNAEDYATGKIKDFSQVGVKVISDSELQVTLGKACPYFLDLASFPTLFPVPLEVIKKFDLKWTLPENIVSNGAYSLIEWKRRDKIEMAKNQNYWDKDFCKLEKITILPIDEMETAYKKFINNELHWITSIPISKVPEAKKMPEYYQHESLSTYFFRFNVETAPFNDVRLRKALSLSIDREDLTKHVLNGIHTPATYFSPPAAGYIHAKGLPYNMDEAKKLLKESGLHTEEKPLTIELTYNKNNNNQKVAEYLSEVWMKNLGIKVTLKNTEWKTNLEDMEKRRYQMVRSAWSADYNDPNSFFDMFVTNGGNNRTGWSNKKYDDLLIKTQDEKDKGKRMLLFQEMEKILVEEDFPILPLYITVNNGLLKETVNGWYSNLLSYHPFKYIWLE